MLKDPHKPLPRKVIIKLYKPHPGQLKIHNSKARFRIVCCGRRFGKTFMACNELIRFVTRHNGVETAWISPSYRQSKIAYRLIKRALKDVAKCNDSELRMELQNGSVISFCSAENYDALRGNGYHFVVMDESADIREEAWNEVIRPAISDKLGRVLMIGTPKGRNFFFKLFCYGADPEMPEWEAFTAPTAANPYVPASEIEAAKKELPEDTFAQEYLAVFLEESAGVFRKIDAAIRGLLDPDYLPIENHFYTLGWDPAKYQDYSVVTVMDAHLKEVVAWERFNQIDYSFQIEQVKRIAEKFRAYSYVDMTGPGDAVYEQFKAKYPYSEGYLFTNASKKVLIEKLQLGFQNFDIHMPEVPVLQNELRQFEYHMTPSRNVVYEAPKGAHDDTVISLALAYYGAQQPRGPVMWSADVQAQQQRSLEQPASTDNTTYTMMEIDAPDWYEEGEWTDHDL